MRSTRATASQTLFFLTTLASGIAQADVPENDRSVALEVRDPGATVDTAALRAALANELRVSVVVAPGNTPPTNAVPAPSSERIVVSVDASRRLQLTYRDARGREVLRAVALPDDPSALVSVITLLAGNLARNEAREIADGLVPNAAAAPIPVEEPAPIEIAPQTAPVMTPAPPSVVVVPLVIVPPTGLPGGDTTPGTAPAAPGARRPSAWGLTFEGGTALYSFLGPTWQIGAGVDRRWGAFAVGMSARFSTLDNRAFVDVPGPADVRGAALLSARWLPTIGPVRFELGAAMGAQYRSSASNCGWGSICLPDAARGRSEHLEFLLRPSIGLGLVVHPSWTLFARADLDIAIGANGLQWGYASGEQTLGTQFAVLGGVRTELF